MSEFFYTLYEQWVGYLSWSIYLTVNHKEEIFGVTLVLFLISLGVFKDDFYGGKFTVKDDLLPATVFGALVLFLLSGVVLILPAAIIAVPPFIAPIILGHYLRKGANTIVDKISERKNQVLLPKAKVVQQ